MSERGVGVSSRWSAVECSLSPSTEREKYGLGGQSSPFSSTEERLILLAESTMVLHWVEQQLTTRTSSSNRDLYKVCLI